MSGAGASTGSTQQLLALVLDLLVPPVDELAGAGGLGLGAQVPADVAEPVLGLLPPDVAQLARPAQLEALRAVEAAVAWPFSELVRHAYIAYYRDPRVLARVERISGYAARPPQPAGYRLEPLDMKLLAVVSARPPLYRDTRHLVGEPGGAEEATA